MRRIHVLVWKEWAELIHRKSLIAMTLAVPLLVLVLAIGIALVLPAILGSQIHEDEDLESIFSVIAERSPELANLGTAEFFQVFILQQFMLFLLIAPVMCGLTISTHSIIGEKVNRSLEPLLATPVTTAELLSGKCMAAAIPSVAVAWFFFALYVAAIVAFTDTVIFHVVVNATALCIIALWVPTIAVLGLSLGLIASSRSTDPRSEQQVSVLVILPLIALIVFQTKGVFQLTPGVVIIGAVVLGAIDAVILRVGAALFSREAILTRWR
jgi:ABC-2 type transport system permease protein